MRRSNCLWQLRTPGWGDAIYPHTPPRRVLQSSILGSITRAFAQCAYFVYYPYRLYLPPAIYISLTFQMQTISFKVIDSICWAVPLRHIMFQLGPYILSFTFHPLSSGLELPPTLSRLSLPFIKTVPSSWPCSQASNFSTRFL